MSGRRLRCLFCYEESKDTIVASSEHLLSRPVAAAFGIDRGSWVARNTGDGDQIRFTRLDGVKNRCVCTSCNNGWMNRLETRMAAVADWLAGPDDVPLGPGRAMDLRAWALKTHLLLCFICGNAHRFGDDDFGEEAVVPPVTVAKALFRGNTAVLDETTVAVSRSRSKVNFAWLFGYPSASAPGGVKGHPRFAPISVVTVGDLQVWMVTPMLSCRIELPDGVRPCAPQLRPVDLAPTLHPMDPGIVHIAFD